MGAVVLAVIIGGLLRVPSQSTGYLRSVDRSFALQARPVVQASNRLGRKLHTVLASMTAQQRSELELELDTLVRSSASLAREAATAASPSPAGGAGVAVAAAMSDRAIAMLTIRTAVDRLLGMTPVPVAGAPDPAHSGVVARRLTAAGAAAKLDAAGALLARGDRDYAAGRHALRNAPGHARLPSSVWSSATAAWSSSGTTAMADALVSSATLAAVHRVELLAHTLALTPAPVPSAGTGTTQSVSVLPPTGRVGISVVVENAGNVAAHRIVVRATLREVGSAPSTATSGGTGGTGTSGGTGTTGTSGTTPATGTATGIVTQSKPRRISLAAGSSVSVTLPSVRVTPDHHYTVEVTVEPPVPDVAGAVTSDALSFRVAPPGPPTVAQLLPTNGRARGGTDVTILGSGFTWVTAVTFGSVSGRFKVVSSTQITVVSPPGTGTVAVHVHNAGGASPSSSADQYRYRRK